MFICQLCQTQAQSSPCLVFPSIIPHPVYWFYYSLFVFLRISLDLKNISCIVWYLGQFDQKHLVAMFTSCLTELLAVEVFLHEWEECLVDWTWARCKWKLVWSKLLGFSFNYFFGFKLSKVAPFKIAKLKCPKFKWGFIQLKVSSVKWGKRVKAGWNQMRKPFSGLCS